MKKFLLVLTGLLVLLVVAITGFLYTFDANDYKNELTGLAQSITGRDVRIAGDIEITLFPLIGIKIDSMTIGNPPGFSNETFATIDHLDVEIEISPLLQKRLNIEKLVLNKLVADFEANAAGDNNWSDFMAGDGRGAGSSLGLNGLSIAGMEMTDARLSWLDVSSGKHLNLSNMNLETEGVAKDRPLPVIFKAHVDSNVPEWQGSVFVQTELAFDRDSPVFNTRQLKLVVKALLPGTDLDKLTVAMIADGEVNVQQASAKLSGARIGMLGLKMNGELNIENIFSEPVVQGPLKLDKFSAQALAQQFKMQIPELANPQSLKNISLTTMFKTDFSSIYLDNIVANVDESRVNGHVYFENGKTSSIEYKLKIDRLDYRDYQRAETLVGKSDTMIPLELIRTGRLEGVLDIDTVEVDDIELNRIHMVSNISNGVLKIEPVSLLVGESELKASMRLDAQEIPQAEINMEVNNIDADAAINPVLKSMIGDDSVSLAGMVNASANLQASGESLGELEKSAYGVVNITMDTGVLTGIDLDHASRSVVADYSNKNNLRTRRSYVPDYKPGHETAFDSLGATFELANGRLVNNDLHIITDQATISGSGSIDFINRKIDYRPVIDINVASRVDIRDKLRDHPMEYHTHGRFEKVATDFNYKKYDMLLGRLLVQEAKARKIQRQNSTSNAWHNAREQ